MLVRARAYLRKESEADEEMVCTICLYPVYINIDAEGNVEERAVGPGLWARFRDLWVRG